MVLKLSETIKYIEISELETKEIKDISLNKDSKVDMAITIIIH